MSKSSVFYVSMIALAGCGGARVEATVPTPTVSATVSAQPQPVVQQPIGPQVSIGAVPVATTNPAYVSTPVNAGWLPTGYIATDYVSQHMSLRARQFAVGMTPITDMFRASMNQGERQNVVISATAGYCYRVIGVGGAGVRDLDLFLYDMAGNLIDQDRAPDNFPVLGLQRPLCLPVAGTARLEVRMFAGAGQVGVQAFAIPASSVGTVPAMTTGVGVGVNTGVSVGVGIR
jgi:hypothetical protein